VATALSIPSSAQTWSNSVFSLVTGAFLLPFGRLSDMYGGYSVFMGGMVWFTIWTLASGFSTNYMTLVVTRALAGLGPAAFLTAGIMILGKIYRPGPRKNLVFSLYGACAALGFFLGILIAGVAGQFLSWRWYFWLGAILLLVVCLTSLMYVPNDFAEHKGGQVKMDLWGTVTTVPALILVVFAITDGAHAPDGWSTPYVIVTFVLGVLFLGAAVYVEGWVAENPLLPFDLFKPKYMVSLTIALFFSWGVFGTFLFYSSF
jgi:MFS family permease